LGQPVCKTRVNEPADASPGPCAGCASFPVSITAAFQPIVHLPTRRVYGYEALVRGMAQEPAQAILSMVTDENKYSFDQACRRTAIAEASRLGLKDAYLSINFLPGAMYDPATCIKGTLAAAAAYGFPLDRIVFEVTEGERVTDHDHLQAIFTEYRRHGLRTAIDDFGEGYSGLGLLARFQPHIVKLDLRLVRGIHRSRPQRAIVAAVNTLCRDLDLTLIAEGVETTEELAALSDIGLELFQGYLFARPGFRSLPVPVWPASEPG
jgi:EAL domain-containing protein (putative c-di-GMP-specific phosphodiesterase class I)